MKDLTYVSRSSLQKGLAAQVIEEQEPPAAVEQESIEDIISPLSRRLLSMEMPVEIVPQYCAPSGACNLSNLRDGLSGFAMQGEAGNDMSGQSVSAAGDVNGDGVGDLVIGAYQASPPGGRTQAGKSYVIFGSRNNSAWGNGTLGLGSLMNGVSGFVLQGEAANDYSGYSVSAAGDVNGDGVGDLVIGAYQASPPGGRTQAGKSYVIFGSRNSTTWVNGTLELSILMDGVRGFVLQGPTASERSGYSVSAAGDVNDDGVNDLVIGTSWGAGKSYVVFGSRNNSAWGNGTLELSSLINGIRGFVLQGQANDVSGYSVSAAGDVNGDGVDDLVIGAPSALSGVGRSYVVFGSGNSTAWGTGTLNLISLINGVQGFVLQGEPPATDPGRMGSSVSAAGDVNDDGVDDLVIGAWSVRVAGFYNTGRSYVVFGSRNSTAWGSGTLDVSSLMNGVRGFMLQGQANDASGWSVSAAGDMNRDGVDDLLIGAPFSGKSYVVFGSRNSTTWGNGTLGLSSLMNGVSGFVLQGEAAGDDTGQSVSAAGDVNGDGVDDLVIGAPQGGASYRGRSYVVFGYYGSAQQWFNQLISYKSSPVILNSENLNVTYSQPLRFNVSAVSNGRFEFVSNPGQAITLFNQTDAWARKIQFVQSGVSSAPSYSLQIVSQSRLVSFPPQSADITYFDFVVTNQLTIHQGDVLRMDSAFLNAYSNYTSDLVNITIMNLQHGEFLLEPFNTSVNQFSQAELFAGQVLFAHDNSREAPGYNVIITDPSTTLLASDPADITFYRRPFWYVNQLTLTQGDTVFLGTQQINVTADVPSNLVWFSISDLQHGQFKLNTSTAITNFTQEQLLNGQVSFTHDDTGLAPGYRLGVQDNYFTITPESALVTFTSLPPTFNTNRLTVYQGRNQTLTSADLSATDPDPSYNSSALIFVVSDVQHGQFILKNSSATVTQFAQVHVNQSNVVFVHDGSTSQPSYLVTAGNPYQNTTATPVSVFFDKRPVVINNRLTLETGESVVLALTNIQAVDDHTPSGELVFTVSNVNHGYFAELQAQDIPIAQFSQQRVRDSEIQFQHDGSSNVPSYIIKVTDSSGLESNQTSAQINFKNTITSSGIDYQKLYTSVSSIGGIALAIAGYMWWRRKTTEHRRGFELANNLRKAANLEYHDFMRFDGDVYKSKVENLLDHLPKGFYKSLTPEQRKSFAVCIVEILEERERHLLKPSDYGMGIYGWIFAFSVGWSQQLDLKKFDAQLEDIANQAVTAWKAEENPTRRWPYFSPTCKDKVNAFCCARPSRAGIFARDKVRLSRSESVSLMDLKSDSKHQAVNVSSSGQKDMLVPVTEVATSERIGLIEKQLQQVSEGMQYMQRGIQEIAGNVKTINERVGHLETENRPLLAGLGSSSS